jgi:hypothetical protein
VQRVLAHPRDLVSQRRFGTQAAAIAVAACAGIAAIVQVATAQTYDDDFDAYDDFEDLDEWAPRAQAPEAFRRFEVMDLTFGMRDDAFGTITVDPRDGTIYVGSGQGRVYRSRPGDPFWDEGNVVREVKPLYGFAGQIALLGSLRSDGRSVPSRVRLGGLPGIHGLPNSLAGQISSAQDLQLGGPGSPSSDPLRSVLDGAAAGAAGGGGGALGVGLSAGAPRLSILLGQWGRTVPVISIARTLGQWGARTAAIWRIVPHPQDPDRIYVGTGNGLYMSTDGGISFVRTFAGMSAANRGIAAIVVDPTDPDRIFLGTTRGLFVSTDRGDNWAVHTRASGMRVQAIAIDPTDPNYIYVATSGGLFRSTDGGENFLPAFFSAVRNQNNIGWVEIDPFDPNTVYLATRDGVVMSDDARRARTDGWRPIGALRTINLNVPKISACTRHPGHLYIVTRADLHTINYGAHGPESYVAESWDGGETWRELMGGRTAGDIRWFEVDPEDPDRVYVVFSRAIVRLERTGPERARQASQPLPRTDFGPPLGDVLDAALVHHGLQIGAYNDAMDRFRRRAWFPRVTVKGYAWRRQFAHVYDDAQFADERFLGASTDAHFGVMAWATWALPDVVYRHDAHAMIKLRVNVMNDEVRNQVARTIHRNYGELQRLRARLAASPPQDLYTRAMYHVRMEQLEAVVDLASGGYLSSQPPGRNDAD